MFRFRKTSYHPYLLTGGATLILLHQGWDGTYHKIPQEMGNYIWSITLVDIEGNSEKAQGSVLLLR
jgi:hypothetical protein